MHVYNERIDIALINAKIEDEGGGTRNGYVQSMNTYRAQRR